VIDVLPTIHTKTDFEHFIVGGSCASANCQRNLALTLSNDDEVPDKLFLVANDIDIYHRCFNQNTNKSTTVDFEGGIEKFEVAGLSLEMSNM
jgi:hypothetical protein